LQKYIDVASEYDCIVQIRNQHYDFINKIDSIETNLPKMLEWINRIKISCETTSADWILNLEDDVVVKRNINQWPISDVGTCRNYFRPGGGSIFKREVFLDSIKKVDISQLIKIVPDASWAGDLLLQNIFTINNVTFEEWVELAEPNYRDTQSHAIYHGYKELHKLG
jgi:hypothetical protein